MIIYEQGDQLVVIRQTDHSLLAGFLAREWGNEEYTRPEPSTAFRLAAAEHDNGWTEWELAPQIDPVTFSPFTFMSIPTEEHIDLYKRGMERLIKADHYAGLLVSMHCAGLYDRARATMPGFSAKYVKSNETAAVSEFVQRLRLQQLRLKVDLRSTPSMQTYAEEKYVERNLQRLEALDRLSLYFCMGPLGDAVIDGVPMDNSGREADWELRPEGKNAVSLSPYPFRRDPLDISILARRVPKRPYSDSADFQKTLGLTQYFAMNFTLRAGGAHMQSRAARA
jgi:Protein of unknown function (DUF3891)